MTTRPTRRTGSARRSPGILLLAVLLGVLTPAAVAAPASAQSAAARSAAAWTDLPSSAPAARRGAAPEVDPSRFRALGLDRDALAEVLENAPRAAGAGGAARSAGLIIAIPAPDGRDRRFRITRTSVLAPALAAEHPEIATYAGVGVDVEGSTVRLDLTPAGFHASVRGPGGSWYVDPRYRGEDVVYASYRGEDLDDQHGGFAEGQVPQTTAAPRAATASRPGGSAVVMRTYRLALLNDPAYAAYHASRGGVLAAKATLIQRVNQIYEDDLAIRLELVEGSATSLNLDTTAKMTTPDGPCGVQACFTTAQAAACATGTDGAETIDRSTVVLNTLVPGAAYDVGHLVLGVSGGGVAWTQSVGGAKKGGGCTGVQTPVGDLFAVDYVAHELGHQFGADHTFNGTDGSCAGNRANHGVEPGSGSTIMGYAGICDTDDLQGHTDPYFSQESIEQITTFVDGTAVAAGATSTSGNLAPEVTVPPAATIPARTPFALTGSATDGTPGALRFLWEQDNTGGTTGTALSTTARASGPLFRVFGQASVVSSAERLESPSAGLNEAGPDPTRTFPDLAQVSAGNTNQLTGACPGSGAMKLECLSELLPTTSYGVPMRFRLTARDGLGGVAAADTTVSVAPGSQPFRVTAPGTGTTVAGGGDLLVTWDRGSTTAAPVSTANVRITLSIDGGLTFPTILAATTANDGTQTVVVPNVATTGARVKVEALENVYFDVSHADVTITAAAGTSAPTVANDASAGRVQVQHTDLLSPVAVTASDVDTPGASLTATATGLPVGLALSPADGGTGSGGAGSPGTRSWAVAGTVDAAPGTYPVTATVLDGTGQQGTTTFDVVVAPEDAVATFSGDAAVVSAPGAGTATAALRADVAGAVPGDATPGDVGLATVTFREGVTTLCADVPVATAGTPGAPGAGRASCTATLTVGADHPITVVVGGRYTATTPGSVRVTATPAEPTTTTQPATPTQPTVPTPPTGSASPLNPGTVIPPLTPAVARLRPVLTATAKRLRVSRAGRVPVRMRCSTSGTGTVAATCRGTLRITAKLGGRTRTAGTATFRIARTATKTVNVRLNATARRLLRRSTKATVAATASNAALGTLKASRGVTLVPRR